jgi:hypothetical protein
LKNAELCPVNNPDPVRDARAATAPALLVDVGRITEQSGSLESMNWQGSGMIRFF